MRVPLGLGVAADVAEKWCDGHQRCSLQEGARPVLHHRSAGIVAGGDGVLGAIFRFRAVGPVHDLALPEARSPLVSWAQSSAGGGPCGTEAMPGAFAVRPVVETEMHNVMLRCAACGRALAEQAAWKGSGERYYCNEFCADAEAAQSPSLVPTMPEDARAPMPAPPAQGRG